MAQQQEGEGQAERRCVRRKLSCLEPTADSFGQVDARSLPKFLSSAVFGQNFLRTILSSHTPLGNFCVQSLDPTMMTGSHCQSDQLWPCSIPDSLAAPSTKLSGRRRSRWKLRSIIREHLRVFVCISNWLVLGRPKSSTLNFRQPHSAAQRAMLSSLEQSLRLWYRLASGHSSGLERAYGKFTHLHDHLSRLETATSQVRSHLDPYGRSSFSSSREKPDEGPSGASSGKPVMCKASQASTALQVEPDRLVFEHPPSFHAEGYIADPLLKSGFLNPAHLRAPKEDWPKVRPARVMCSRDRLLALFKKWDNVGSFSIIPVSESEVKYRCGLLAVYKNEEKDRQILNPIPENGRTIPVNESATSLAHGTLLCGLYLPPHEELVISADDLEDFYHSYIVPQAHAARNHIHGVFESSVFEGWNCWDSKFVGKMVVGCFNTLAMGTSFAVEVAQHSHTTLLQREGCLIPTEQVKYRSPLPRGPVYQLLCIDDFCVLQRLPKELCQSVGPHRRDLETLASAGRGYSKAGLRTSKKKAIRGSQFGTVLGSEIDGKRGLINAPRIRTLTLCQLTLSVVRLGWATRKLLESMVGCWIFVLLFRRPLFALISELFHEGSQCKEDEAFQLSVGAKQELLLLVGFAGFASTNLRAAPSDRLFASDASLQGAGLCSSVTSRFATLELCRVAEQRGYYTRVYTSTLGAFDARTGGIFKDPDFSIPKVLHEGYLWDFCEVFRGSGILSHCHREAGLRVHQGFELQTGSTGNILECSTMLCIVGLICRRVIRCFHVAPVCCTFGTLRKPRLRSRGIPAGFNLDDPDTSLGNRFAWRAAYILNLCLHYNLQCSVEQPGGSVMFYMGIFRRALQTRCYLVKFPFCGWGTPYKKPSSWIVTNPLLAGLSAPCACGKAQHFRVRGFFDTRRLRQFRDQCSPSLEEVFHRAPFHNEHVAHFAAAYPKTLCKFVAQQNVALFSLQGSETAEEVERPYSTPPRWISELGRSLHWRKVLQYAFRKLNHINIDESLSYRSLLKHLAKT